MTAEILSPTPRDLDRIAQALHNGEVAAIPTETVYGLAGLATRPDALATIFSTKERPTFDPLILHVGRYYKDPALLEQAGWIDLRGFSREALALIEKLLEAFWPGPLTLVLPKGSSVHDLATSGLPTVALRMPRHPVAQALLELVQPLAAPSANRFGRISPTTAAAVREELGDRIRFILDGGPCEVGVESTILSVSASGELALLRPGGAPVEAIEALIGRGIPSAASSTRPLAPGMLESHYAPLRPLRILPRRVSEIGSASELGPGVSSFTRLGVLLVSGDPEAAKAHLQKFTAAQLIVLSLSPSKSWEEAARNLFSMLRELDGNKPDLILAEPCGGTQGLAHAIADRLSRAAAPKG